MDSKTKGPLMQVIDFHKAEELGRMGDLPLKDVPFRYFVALQLLPGYLNLLSEEDAIDAAINAANAFVSAPLQRHRESMEISE